MTGTGTVVLIDSHQISEPNADSWLGHHVAPRTAQSVEHHAFVAIYSTPASVQNLFRLPVHSHHAHPQGPFLSSSSPSCQSRDW